MDWSGYEWILEHNPKGSLTYYHLSTTVYRDVDPAFYELVFRYCDKKALDEFSEKMDTLQWKDKSSRADRLAIIRSLLDKQRALSS